MPRSMSGVVAVRCDDHTINVMARECITRQGLRCVAVRRHALAREGQGPGAEPKNGNGDVSDATVCVHILRLSAVCRLKISN